MFIYKSFDNVFNQKKNYAEFEYSTLNRNTWLSGLQKMH